MYKAKKYLQVCIYFVNKNQIFPQRNHYCHSNFSKSIRNTIKVLVNTIFAINREFTQDTTQLLARVLLPVSCHLTASYFYGSAVRQSCHLTASFVFRLAARILECTNEEEGGRGIQLCVHWSLSLTGKLRSDSDKVLQFNHLMQSFFPSKSPKTTHSMTRRKR